MAVETRASQRVPEVDVLSRIVIERLGGSIAVVFQPSKKVMDGEVQASNRLGQPHHIPAVGASDYTLRADWGTPEGIDRLVMLQAETIAHIVAWTLVAVGQQPDEEMVEAIVTQLMQAGYTLDEAMTQVGEGLRNEALDAWDAYAADWDWDANPTGPHAVSYLKSTFGLSLSQGQDGPFQVPVVDEGP
jgi:hypothetical protein